MAITDADLQFFYPATINDTSANGGRISHLPITTNVVQNVWPNVPKAERDAGSTKYRKVFAKLNANNSDILYFPGIFLEAVTPAADRQHFVVGTQRNTQGDLAGSEDKFGAGVLVSQSGTTLVVDVETAALATIFRDALTIRVSDKATPSSVTGNEETRVISGTPSVVDNRVTITMDSALSNVYAAGSKVASIYKPSSEDLKCVVDNWVETSAAGTFDEGGFPLIMNNKSTIEQTWTLTMLNATTFSVVGDTVGSVGSGDITTDFAPNNPNFSLPYFTLEFDGFGGTWATGNTIVFQTHPAAIPIFEVRTVPAGATSYSGNYVNLVFTGEA